MLTEHITKNTRRLIVGAVTVATVIAAAAVTASAVTGSSNARGASSQTESGRPGSYAPVVGNGARALTKAGLSLSSDLGPSAIAKRITAALRASSGVEAVTMTPDGQKSAISVQMDRHDDSLVQHWYAELAIGATAQLSATTQTSLNELVSEETVTGPNAEGVTTTTDLGVGAAALNQAFNSPSDEVLATRVDDVAQQFGLKADSAQVLHPLESAASVTFTVPDGAKIDWTIDQLRTALVGEVPDMEGVLIQINAADGDPLLRASVAYRTATGSLWFAPGQDARFGALHGTFVGDDQ